MRFERVYIDGEEYYKKIEDKDDTGACCADMEEGKKDKNENPSLSTAEKIKIEGYELFDRVKCAGATVGRKIKEGAIFIGEKIKGGAEAIFRCGCDKEDNIKAQNLISLLPSMTDEQKHSLVLSLISNTEALREIEPTEVFPHLTAEDSDLLFVALVSQKDYAKDLSVALGTISEGLLGRII